MTEEITPALTPEEWRQVEQAQSGEYAAPIMAYQMANHGGHLYAGRRHALAALCLYGQPFGFTGEDVDAIRFVADCAKDGDSELGWPGNKPPEEIARAYSAAARIAALLSPEDAK